MPTRVAARRSDLQALAPADVRRARRPHAARAPRAGRCRGRSRRSTTASCARCCGSRPTTASSSSRPRRSTGRDGRHRAHRPRRAARAADRRRARLAARALERDADPAAGRAASRAASRSTRTAAARTSSCGSTRATCRAGYGWSFPARDELRVGVGSFGPRTTSRSRPCGSPRDLGLPPGGYQGNWIPHQLRPAVEDGVFFAGDSAGHCLPLTAEGIRTALYFGLACGRELRAVLEGRAARASRRCALRRVLRRAREASSAGCCAPSGPSGR